MNRPTTVIRGIEKEAAGAPLAAPDATLAPTKQLASRHCDAGVQTVSNVLSFDVEDYFQVANFEASISFESWGSFESRVERNTTAILELLAEYDLKATFFMLGWIAERYPRLTREIAEAGHEVGSHSYGHKLVYTLTPDAFREDLRRSIGIIEERSGQKVVGFRAPSFSITNRSLWALDILMEEGMLYDSSIFPVKHHRYGIPQSPRIPHEIRSGLMEFPMATARIGTRNIPVAGGAYFRFYPYALTYRGMAALNNAGFPAMLYLHPWEFDPEQPRIRASLQARIRHYTNLNRTAPRLRRLCRDFHFTTARKVLGI